MPNYLTQQDVQDYGTDLVDFARRAAADALAPTLAQLGQQNAQLQQQVARTARQALDQRVESAIPNYREIDRDPAWHQFLLTVDPLSGRVRQVLLNDAIAASDAARVISFFHMFQRENRGSEGGSESHGNRRTASSHATSSGLPTYTRAQIKQLYEAHRQGAYAGREAEWARQEVDIIRASREGRILGADYMTK